MRAHSPPLFITTSRSPLKFTLALLHGWFSCESAAEENIKEGSKGNIRSNKNFIEQFLILRLCSFFKFIITIGPHTIREIKNKTLQTLKANENMKKVPDLGYFYQDRTTMSNEWV